MLKLKHSMSSLACYVISLHSSLLVLTTTSYQSELVTKHTMAEFSGSCASSLRFFLAVSIRFTDGPYLHYFLIFEALHLFLQIEIIELRTSLKSRPRASIRKKASAIETHIEGLFCRSLCLPAPSANVRIERSYF